MLFYMLVIYIVVYVYTSIYICYVKSLQSCLTLCDPIDGSPPGSTIPGILQARILEWGAIAYSDYIYNQHIKQHVNIKLSKKKKKKRRARP